VAVSFSVTAMLGLSAPQPAQAAINPCGTTGHWFAGATSAPLTSIFGAEGLVEYNNPDLCGDDTTGSGFSSAWVMVTALGAGSTSPARQGWAQIGYGQFGAASGYRQGRLIFSQWTDQCVSDGTCLVAGHTETDYGPAPSGGSTTYQVWKENSGGSGHIYMAYNFGAPLGETGYNPTGHWDPKWQTQFLGEVHQLQSDIPGTVSDVTTMANLGYYDSTTYLHYFTGGLTGTSGNRYHRDVYDQGDGTRGVNIWTDPLS